MERPHLHRGDEITVHLTDAAFEGKAVARHEGMVLFVERAVPGDTALVRVTAVKRSFAEATLTRVLTPSPLRVEPRCRHFGVCGGCRWQQVEYAAQLRFKQQHVVDALERIGGFTGVPVEPIVGSEHAYFYRGKMEYSFSRKQWLIEKPVSHDEGESPAVSAVYLGLHVPQRYDKVLEIDDCQLQSPTSNRILNATREFARQHNLTVHQPEEEEGYLRFLVIRESKRTGERMVNLVTYSNEPEIMRAYTRMLLAEVPDLTTVVNTINSSRAQIAFGQREEIYLGEGFIREEIGGLRFKVSASSFFQTNVPQAERLYQTAREFAELVPDDVVYDLYSGTGTIALYLADAVRRVVGVESVASAIRDAEKNAGENGITNCAFVEGDLKDRLTKNTEWMNDLPRPTVVVVDPPRSGMHPKVVDEVVGLDARRIVYVSCNPATQARDLKQLCAERYRLVKVRPVDMFPHTYHVENVAVLERKSN